MPLNQSLRKNSNILWTISIIQDQNPNDQTQSEFSEMTDDVLNTETIDSVTLCLADNLQRFRLMIQHGISEEEAIIECQKLADAWRQDNSTALSQLLENKKLCILTWQEFLEWPEKEKTLQELDNLYKENRDFKNDVDVKLRQVRDKLPRNSKISNPIEQNFLLKKYLMEECAFQKFAASKGFNYEVYKTQCSKSMRRIKNNTDFVPKGLMREIFFTQFGPKAKNSEEKNKEIVNETFFTPLFSQNTHKTAASVSNGINNGNKSQIKKISEFIEKTLELIPDDKQAKAAELLIKFASQELIPLCYSENVTYQNLKI